MPTHVPFLKGQTRDGEARKVTHLPQRCQGLFCGEGQIMCLIMIQGLTLQHQGHTLLLIHSISCWGHWEVCIKIRAGTRLLRNEETPLWEAPGIPDIAQCGKKAFNIWLSLGYRDPCLACVYSGNNWTHRRRGGSSNPKVTWRVLRDPCVSLAITTSLHTLCHCGHYFFCFLPGSKQTSGWCSLSIHHNPFQAPLQWIVQNHFPYLKDIRLVCFMNSEHIWSNLLNKTHSESS